MSGARRQADQALAVPATPAGAVDGPSGFDPSRYEYRFSIREGHERHDWIASGEYGAVNIWAEPSTPSFGDRWYGGIEGHSKTPADYQDATKPSQELCWLLLAPCWHEGSSLQFSEQVEPTLPAPNGRAMGGHVLEGLKYLLRSRYRSWIAEPASGMEARSDATPKSGAAEGDSPTAESGDAR